MDEAGPFFEAVRHGDLPRVAALLASEPGLAVARDESGATALHHATFDGHHELVELLLAHGAELNAYDGTHGATPSGWAIHRLRERGGLLAIEIDDALHAIHRCDAHWVERLVRRHPQLRDALDREGTPLALHAARSGDATIMAAFTRPTD